MAGAAWAAAGGDGGIDEIDSRSPDVYADVTCRDGRGYDFYREPPVRDRPPLDAGGQRHAHRADALDAQPGLRPDGLGATAVSSDWTYGGSIGGVVWWDTDGGPARTVTFRICGHRGTQVDCLKPEPVYQFGKPYDPTWINGAKLSPMETEARRGEPDIR